MSSSGQFQGDNSKKRHAQDTKDKRSDDTNKRQKTNRRRRPIDPSSLPRFLDSTGAVTASTFAARRLPEMKSLWRSFLSTKHAQTDATLIDAGGITCTTSSFAAGTADATDDAALYRSGGRKTSDRHLRRRTGSHCRRRRHRYPAGGGLPASVDGPGDETNTADDGDVMMATRRKKPSKEKENPCRRARRKRGLLCEAHRHWQSATSRELTTSSPLEASTTPQHSPVGTTAAPTKWLETHLWHTKRFHMGNLFGWSVPLVHTGRGTAAALRLAQTNCTVQDGTWSIDGGATELCAPSMKELISTLAKLCGEQAEALQDKSVLSGRRWGEGTVHRPGAYPLGVIGPARFLFYRHEENGIIGTVDGSGCKYRVAIFVHPAIREKLDEAARLVIMADCECSVGQIGGGLALFKVRGANAMNSIKSALGPKVPSAAKDQTITWDQVSNSSQAHRILPHGTIIPVKLSPKLRGTDNTRTCDNANADRSNAVPRNTIEENSIAHIAATIYGKDEEPRDLPLVRHDVGSTHFAVLISHRPNNGSSQIRHNVASCGWDILCAPSMARDIFLCLNNNGGACAVGLAEEANAALEAEPPISTFPRDFPDTMTGEAYWSGQDSEWNIVRCCLEHGSRGGRFKTELKRTTKTHASETYSGGIHYHPIDWKSITDCIAVTDKEEEVDAKDKDEGTGGVEVVRGAFGAPFAQALTSSGRFAADTETAVSNANNAKKRRPRRRVRPANVAAHAEPLGDDEADAHENMCQMLLSSLSLPALLRCHISIEGKGNLLPGATIFECNKDAKMQSSCGTDTTLGYVVAGSFSSNRGLCHGPGFVGARRLLHSLVKMESANTVSVMNQGEEGDRSVALRVLVKNAAAGGRAVRSATLTLMML